MRQGQTLSAAENIKIFVQVRTLLVLRLDVKVDLKKIKLYYMEDDGGSPFGSPVHKELK